MQFLSIAFVLMAFTNFGSLALALRQPHQLAQRADSPFSPGSSKEDENPPTSSGAESPTSSAEGAKTTSAEGAKPTAAEGTIF